MMRRAALLALCSALAACGEEKEEPGPGGAIAAAAPAVEVEIAAEPEEPPVPELDPEERARLAEARAARARRGFEKVLGKLDDTSERYERHAELDESAWFGEDQKTNQAAIDSLLDELAGLLAGSELVDVRERIRAAERESAVLEARGVRDREAQVSAPRESELSVFERPFVEAWEDLDQRIRETRGELDERRLLVIDLEQQFLEQLRALGVEVTPASAKSLLGTVSGDDFVELCAVLDNVRHVTVELQRLTEESGESLDVARRYYGCYVVLIRVLDRLQREFVRTIADEQVPRLRELAEQATENVAEAQAAIRAGGDRELLAQNVRSNELTREAAGDRKSVV